jgi:dolichol-phosphate mannosyltransferase
MKLSIIVPCYNEEKNILNFYKYISKLNFLNEFEVIFVNDYSTDNTKKLFNEFISNNSRIKFINNKFNKGLGGTIKTGIKQCLGEFITIMMCDSSDTLEDLEKYFREIEDGKYDAIMGSRFLENSKIINYPLKKLILNRIFNYLVKIIFWSDYNDFTNAFKIYKKKTLIDIEPLVSESFNIFLEIPLKIISRKYKYKIIPISWKNLRNGVSNFKIKELGSKYFFTLIYCFVEKILIVKP